MAACETFVNVIIAEVKRGQCALNGPWTDPGTQNMYRVLKAIGCVPEAAFEAACRALYQHGKWADASVTVRLFAIGQRQDSALMLPLHQQITWDEVIDFCILRFNEYRRQKSSVGQWAADGHQLKRLARGQNASAKIRRAFGLPDGASAGNH